MPRLKNKYSNASNKSFYHYYTEKIDINRNITYKYFLTINDIIKELGVSKYTINTAINNDSHIIRKHPNLKIKRCYLPRCKEVEYTANELNELRHELNND